ncbi:flagellar hook-basal body complex protein FliE [Sphingomonas oleivorans]|uniref:Flagellar hook-basal body complex protein FliE n=1 Tax=Sphingomonas oleivorans TaxID=1735121 RepID=A0A2T5FYE0_9SPHN|nr:flagellar hook-basal body complex protein FliE [Sphingomonas oleivorans]PTQ11549.1 flagellar hook-basal body complex protein FliE [Sphingomonas oleivorans]
MKPIDTSGLMAMRAAILQQNSALQKAAAPPAKLDGAAEAKGTDFTGALKQALGQVNELQAKSAAATESFERGETTDIAAVMLAREQSSVGFQATLQVRNKLLSAYKDIMSMPV